MVTKRRRTVRRISYMIFFAMVLITLYHSVAVIHRGNQIVTGTFTFADRDQTQNSEGSSYYLIFNNDLYHGKNKILVTKGYYDSAGAGYSFTRTQERYKFYTVGSSEDNKRDFAYIFVVLFCVITGLFLGRWLFHDYRGFNTWLDKET